MKILITGSGGLVGSEAVSFFKEKGWDVVGVDNNMRSHFFGVAKQEGSINLDIREEVAVDRLFSQHKFDAVIHAAAQPSHDYSKDHVLEDFDVNARATVLLLEATRKYCPEAVFVFVSTDKVYGERMSENSWANTKGIKPEAWGEKDPVPSQITRTYKETNTRYTCQYPFDEGLGLDFADHRSLFGCSKTAADLYVQEYGNYFGMKTVCFRPGCITGKNHKGAELHGFMAYLTKCIKEGKTYKVFGYKGKQVRDQIHAYDLVSACWEFIQNPKSGAVYNIGGGLERSVSVLEAIDLLEKETDKKAITEYIDEPRKGDRIWDIHDVSKFQTDYPNWKYKYSLQDIIKDLCA